MSVRRAIATVDPSTTNVTEFCEIHGISRATYYRLRAAFRDHGEGGLEPKSRAPRTVRNRTSGDIEDRIVWWRKHLVEQGLDAGPITIRAHLLREQNPQVVPTASTIYRRLVARGLIEPSPRRQRRRKWRRFSAERANECWQLDATHYPLANRTQVEIINILDDCSRLAVGAKVVPAATMLATWRALLAAAVRWGWPERLLRDNARAFKALGPLLDTVGVAGRHSRPYHPQTCGKVERFHQTMKRYLDAHGPYRTIAELQTTVDHFLDYYNHTRPHRAHHNRTPIDIWTTTPKSGPKHLPVNATTKVWYGIVRKGKLEAGRYHIAVGAKHDGTHATTILTANHGHVITADGIVLRSLTINPNHIYQRLYNRPGRPKQHPPT